MAKVQGLISLLGLLASDIAAHRSVFSPWSAAPGMGAGRITGRMFSSANGHKRLLNLERVVPHRSWSRCRASERYRILEFLDPPFVEDRGFDAR